MDERKIHGPIFQFECEVCDYMGDCWETEAEAVVDMKAHDCVACAPAWVRDEIELLRERVAYRDKEIAIQRAQIERLTGVRRD